MVLNNQHKELITQNENIFKSYIMEKSVIPKLKRESEISVQKNRNSSIFRIDTIGAVNNLIHQQTFINEMKQKEIINKRKRNKNMTIANMISKKVTFDNPSQHTINSNPVTKRNMNDMIHDFKGSNEYGKHYNYLCCHILYFKIR